MRHAIALAERAAAAGEVPVGAVLVKDGRVVGEGWNCPVGEHDPSAHAEIRALRDAGARVGNYRLPGTTLYVTLEPCPMCAGAIVHARVSRVVYGAADPKGGACGSVFALLPSDERFNHQTRCTGGILEELCADQLRAFFRARRRRTRANNGVGETQAPGPGITPSPASG
jgi:tRNA(adenine34) deaminase